ncbi:toll/interleukin-1 receptor domain-containing protein [Terricaulis sp.]|uniref:toll/interleukin-1 receptor domain-containing protein n=1 Tax=Terricaulis sp. TaxID=2768686 RepID=UPI00378386BD
MADVFLSYKRDDRAVANAVALDLKAEGFSVFFDVEIAVGESWDSRIEQALDEASAVVVLWSQLSRDSQWVRREAREALRRGILCPATISECRIPLEFSDIQTANLTGRVAGDRQHQEWRRLIDIGVARKIPQRDVSVEAHESHSYMGFPAAELLGLGYDYLDGTNGKAKNARRALECFLRAVQIGYVTANHDIAEVYRVGRDGVPKDEALARVFYANANWHWGDLELAEMHLNGLGGPADKDKAIEIYRKLALVEFTAERAQERLRQLMPGERG